MTPRHGSVYVDNSVVMCLASMLSLGLGATASTIHQVTAKRSMEYAADGGVATGKSIYLEVGRVKENWKHGGTLLETQFESTS